VALLIETSNAYGRGLLRGVRAFAREHGRWVTYLIEQGRGDPPPSWVPRWGGHGLIARIENRQIARAVRHSGLPVVDVSAARLMRSVPWVETDDRAIAQAAADHLLARGFTRFAYCGDDRFNWSRWRAQAFGDYLRQRGYACTSFTPKSQGEPQREAAALLRWVRQLHQPIGVMACYDIRGRQVMDACRQAGLFVPDEVAVIGVDNDELLCDLCDPPLSSVQPDAVTAGYIAASLLDRIMDGEKVPAEATLIEPVGIETRRSTDGLAIDDAEIIAAMQFIREHACDGIGVGDVLEQVPLSRRVLESRFRSTVGRTPHQEIVRLQMDRAKQLLRETELPVAQIAPRIGYRHAEYLSTQFKKHTGLTPTEYRRRHTR